MSIPIEIIQFKKIYKDAVIQINHLVFDKRITLLVGKNGAGKSTIIKAIAGMINYQGTIERQNNTYSYMCEIPVYPLDLSVYQFLTSLNNISHKTVNENVIDNLLIRFEMDDKKDVMLSALSKGMKSKVNLIQCLMSEADVYLLDEPLSGLDHAGVKSLIKYLVQSSKQFIISTHILDDLTKLEACVVEI